MWNARAAAGPEEVGTGWEGKAGGGRESPELKSGGTRAHLFIRDQIYILLRFFHPFGVRGFLAPHRVKRFLIRAAPDAAWIVEYEFFRKELLTSSRSAGFDGSLFYEVFF